MKPIDGLLRIVEAYCSATGTAEATVSTRVFFDGKRIGDIRKGSDIGVRRLDMAFRWFAANWPEGVDWPADVERPVSEAAE